jgi:hypothetical protein
MKPTNTLTKDNHAARHERIVTGLEEAQQAADALAERLG